MSSDHPEGFILLCGSVPGPFKLNLMEEFQEAAVGAEEEHGVLDKDLL